VLHVAVSEAPSLFDYFNGPSGGVESHFYVRRDGTTEQYRDTGFEADAQAQGNPFFISVETQGMGAGEWTPEQLATLKALIAWAHVQHGFPLRIAPGWASPGVGYHSQFPQWNPNAHACPGVDRIRQFNTIFRPWLAAGGTGDAVTPAEIDAVADAVVTKLLASTPGSSNTITVGTVFQRLAAGTIPQVSQILAVVQDLQAAGATGITPKMIADELQRRLQQ
jgi:hypothetical protein